MTKPYRAAVCALGLLCVPLPATAAETGGAGTPGPTTVTAVACLGSAEGPCRARRTVVRGQEFVVRGRGLQMVTRVIFGGGRSRRDDVSARVTRSSGRYAVGVVPDRARSGPAVLLGPARMRLARLRPVRVRRAPPIPSLDVTPASSFFYGGLRKASFAFEVRRATLALVELVKQETQIVVRSWIVPAQPGQPAVVSWDGRAATGVAPPGHYRFRLTGAAGSEATASPQSTSQFFFADHLFPIRGRHDLGQAPTNNFGGGGQRKHMGQDMFARCGTRLAAARGGQVQYAGYHSAAGNYVVIDGADTDVDYVYMHMRSPALAQTGARVFTGQEIGQVGETGRASGCHLHFELWSAPGWYEGGSAFDPLPSLRGWDAYS